MKEVINKILNDVGLCGADEMAFEGPYRDYYIREDSLYGFDYEGRFFVEVNEVHDEIVTDLSSVTWRRALASDEFSEFKEVEHDRVPKSLRLRTSHIRSRVREALLSGITQTGMRINDEAVSST